MRLSELVGKEIINLTDAARIGVIRTAEALFDLETGKVESILVPFFGERTWGRRRRLLAIPWRAIRRFGRDLIIVEIKIPSRESLRRAPLTAKGPEAGSP
ncbi:MAG: YlmC/YmxH family sporulation protein [Firmicutes bacterium]|nr:YlmC/YmxH family sporulation protein [Bacillota bacterium]